MQLEYITPSRIKSYQICEFKYFLEYTLKYPPLRAPNIYAERGSAVHHALEHYINALAAGSGAAWQEHLKDYYASSKLWTLDNRSEAKGGFPHPVEKTCESCPWFTLAAQCDIARAPVGVVEGCPRPHFEEDSALIEKTLHRRDYEPLKQSATGKFTKPILGVEHEFLMELGGVKVKGVMDLVFEEDDSTIEVCDWKTGRAMSYEAAFKDPQVRIYGAAARKIWPQYQHVIVTLFYLKHRPVSVPLSEKDDEKTLKSLHKYFEEISNNNNPQRQQNYLCKNFCIGYENCGVIQRNLVVDEKVRLPVIQCEWAASDGDCWGHLEPIKQDVNITKAHKLIYTCDGHSKLCDGGVYRLNECDV